MNKEDIQIYLGQRVEITLKPDGEKTSGFLSNCEEDSITIYTMGGAEKLVYEMIGYIKPKPCEPANIHVPVYHSDQVTSAKFTAKLTECADNMKKFIKSRKIDINYVRSFHSSNNNTIFKEVEKIIQKYNDAVRNHDDKPSSDRMQGILKTSRKLYEDNRDNMSAAQIYAFMLYVMKYEEQSVKIYTSAGDFNGAFTVSQNPHSRTLASFCGITVCKKLTIENFARLMKADSENLAAALLWIIDNVINSTEQHVSHDYIESCFEYCAALSWYNLGYNSWFNNEILFSPDNIKNLRNWLADQKTDTEILDEALKIAEKFNKDTFEESKEATELTEDISAITFRGRITCFNNKGKYLGYIECNETADEKYNKYNLGSRIFFHLYQIKDLELRRKLLLSVTFNPDINVTFKIGCNQRGPAAYEICEDSIKIDLSLAAAEEGEIEFFNRYNDPIPFGKIRIKDGSLFTFNIDNVKDNGLKAFLEHEPSPKGHRVLFNRTINDKGVIQITNIRSAEPFSEEQLKKWGVNQHNQEQATGYADTQAFTQDIENLIDHVYIPLEPLSLNTHEKVVKKSLDDMLDDLQRKLEKKLGP